MSSPVLKDQSTLAESDFACFPVWVRAQDYDKDEPWYRETTEQTYRPWDGPLPVVTRFQFPFVLLAASFRLASGGSYPGYIQAATEQWDTPIPPRRMRDGTLMKPLQWSLRHGGTTRSILALHCPVVFIHGRAYDFQLRRDHRLRKRCVLDLYKAVGKSPEDLFPITFWADPTLFNGIVSGQIDGFYSFPLNEPFEIDRGERYLAEAV